MAEVVIYSTQRGGFLPGYEYRNPVFFQHPMGRPKKVIVIGNYPLVVKAYKDLGIDVEFVHPTTANVVPAVPEDLVDELGRSQIEISAPVGDAESLEEKEPETKPVEKVPLYKMRKFQLVELAKSDSRIQYDSDWSVQRLIKELREHGHG